MVENESARLLDIAQAARKLHVSPGTIRRRIADGQLEAYRIAPNGGVRIPESNLDALLVPYERKGQA